MTFTSPLAIAQCVSLTALFKPSFSMALVRWVAAVFSDMSINWAASLVKSPVQTSRTTSRSRGESALGPSERFSLPERRSRCERLLCLIILVRLLREFRKGQTDNDGDYEEQRRPIGFVHHDRRILFEVVRR